MSTNFQGSVNQALGFAAGVATLSGKVADKQDEIKLNKMSEIVNSEYQTRKEEEGLFENFPDKKKKILNKEEEASLSGAINFNQDMLDINQKREEISSRRFDRNPTEETYAQMKADKYRSDIYRSIIERDTERLEESRRRKDARNAARQAQRAAIKAQKVTIGGEEVSLKELPEDLQKAIMNINQKGGKK